MQYIQKLTLLSNKYIINKIIILITVTAKVEKTVVDDSFVLIIERFSSKCHKTKTKIITTANENKGQYQKPMKTQSR